MSLADTIGVYGAHKCGKTTFINQLAVGKCIPLVKCEINVSIVYGRIKFVDINTDNFSEVNTLIYIYTT